MTAFLMNGFLVKDFFKKHFINGDRSLIWSIGAVLLILFNIFFSKNADVVDYHFALLGNSLMDLG
ncbi:hypothetical protein EFN70_01790 [Pediococcus ethanolidurans]|nr:hypothetical protein [Pediococcus ethanolidurans]